METIPATDEIDMAYLKSDQIGKVLAKGLAQVYQVQPQFPIDYLAKWLLNYSQMQNNKEHLDSKIAHQELLRHKLEAENKTQREAHEVIEQRNLKIQQDDTKFKEEIEKNLFHEQFLTSEFCDYLLKQQGGLTGVYVGFVNYPPKQILENDDEDLAHLASDQPKVINYVGSCESHRSFMLGKTLSLELGVTGKVFSEPPAQDPPADGEPPLPIPSMAQYVASVVHDPRMFYFQWPKLGAYLAVPLIYQSCLIDQALDQGILLRQQFRKDLSEQTKEREQKEIEYQDKLRVAQEANEDQEPIHEEYNLIKAEFKDVKEPDFLTEKREFVLCFDTLGQDKEITEEGRKYFEDYTYFFAEKWEQREKQLLSSDIEIMINYYEQVVPKERSDQFTLLEEQAIDGLASKFDDLKEKEKELQFEIQSVRLQTITSQLTEPGLINEFIQLKEMRVLKFPGILQTLLIFLGYSKEHINQPGTNLLDWTKIKPLINDGLFELIGGYTHRGAKHQEIKNYAKLNRIGKRLEKFDLELVENFNVCYGKILKWLKLTIELRKADIEIRRTKIEDKRVFRENRIIEVNKQKEDKSNALQEFKNQLPPEDLENFSQEEWEQNYDQEHVLLDIPDEVEMDIDRDLDE